VLQRTISLKYDAMHPMFSSFKLKLILLEASLKYGMPILTKLSPLRKCKYTLFVQGLSESGGADGI
jgi:hypothetical protein